MRYSVLTLILVFFFSTESFAVNKFKVGEYYSGVIKEAYLNTNDIPLPPGDWRVDDVRIDNQRMYASGWLDGPEGSWIWFSLPLRNQESVKWTANNAECKNSIVKGGSKGVLGQTSIWCISDYKFEGDNTKYIQAMFRITQKKSMILEYFYPKRYMKKLSKSEYEKFGNMMYKSIQDAFKGNGKPLDYLSAVWIENDPSFSSNTSSSITKKNYSSFSDKFICSRATLNDGSGWVQSMQAIDDYVREAWSRSLTIYDCRVLTGRKPLSEANKVEETSTDSSSVKSKLKELKSMLEEGLITQDDFDKKKNELLEEF
jgi:hypothetical protein